MVRRLRIRRLRGTRAPDALIPDLVERFPPPKPVDPRRFADAVQVEPGIEMVDEDRCVAATTDGGDRVVFRWVEGEIRIAPYRDRVVPIALALSRELNAFLVDSLGAQYFPTSGAPYFRRVVAAVPVRPEVGLDGVAHAPDFSESSLTLGHPPVELRPAIVRRVLASAADVEVSDLDDGSLQVRWTGHPDGVTVAATLGEARTLVFDAPDGPTARWLARVAADLGTVCTDPHGVIWVTGDGPGGVAPVAPDADPSGVYESAIHAVVAERARRAFDLEAGVVQGPRRPRRAPPIPWWRRLLGLGPAAPVAGS